jgi:hypothetical protein
MAQTVENLIKIHSKSSLYPEKVLSMDDYVYTFMSFNNKDSLFIDGQLQSDILQSVNTAPSGINYTLILSKKTVSLSGSYVNVQTHNGKIYLFIVDKHPSLKYNGEEIWTATQKHGWGDSWNVMVVLDADLQLMDVKGIDHYNAGFDGIAFGEDRMYLSGNFTNTTDSVETIEVDGYKIVGLGSNWGTQTTFTLTYDSRTGKIIECERFNVNNFTQYEGSQSLLVGVDGSVYQLVMTSFTFFIYEEIELYTGQSNVLIKYTRDGKVDKIVNFFKDNYSFITEMKMTSIGDLILYGECQYGLGFNGVETINTHLPYATVLMALDEGDLSLKWYDYMASELNSNGLSMRIRGMSIDYEDNIYIMNSNGIGLLAEDKEGNTLIPGNHIYKYSKDGKRLSDFRSQFGKPFFLSTKGVDTLIILKGVGSLEGTFDSLLNITNNYGNTHEFALFQFILNKTSGIEDVKKNENDRIYPNPVHKDGLLKISGDHSFVDKNYFISDGMGHIMGSGIIDDTGQIHLSPYHLNSGIYFIRMLDGGGLPIRFVIVD